ncbi:hypothetical protein PFISCL1PPCAC_28263, partial [Pristionchus fissidentatus]
EVGKYLYLDHYSCFQMRHLLILITIVAATAAVQSCGQVKINPVSMSDQLLRANRTGNAAIGGTQAKAGSWPWTVSICKQDWFGNCNFEANGVIIGDRYVLTSESALGSKATDYRVRAGSTNHKSGGQLYSVEKNWILKDEDNGKHHHDMVLMVLASPITFNDYVQPVCVPGDDVDLTGQTGWFTSWGHTSTSWTGLTEDYLHQAKMTVGDGGVCASRNKNYDRESEICVGGAGNPFTTTCDNDMGGPLVQKRADGSWYLLGISNEKSYAGTGCAYATIFARASYYCSSLIASESNVKCIY